MNSDKPEMLQGVLDLLILKILDLGMMHGWGISDRIGRLSKDAFNIKEGSLYPALRRLEKGEWIVSEWGVSANNRKAKFYTLTRTGSQRLSSEILAWERFSISVSEVLKG